MNLLGAHFAEHAQRVVDGPALVAAPGGFVLAPAAASGEGAAPRAAPAARRGLRAVFPAAGGDPVRLSLADGFAVEIREAGLVGSGRLERGAVVYERDGGEASFWSASDAGFEEWLLLQAPAEVRWDVTGATLRQAGAAVELVDTRGRARLRVTAPAAFGQGGAAVTARLRAQGTQLALAVEGAGLVLVDPAWEATGALATARAEHTATLLPSGKVLVVGGDDQPGASLTVFASAELYDPAADAFAPTGPLGTPRTSHTATLLPSGLVLLAGGIGGSGPTPGGLASAELYDPAAETFAATGPLATWRVEHTATLLPSGDVLVAGGLQAGSGSITVLASAAVYDPAAGSFAATGPLAMARAQHTATLLPSGKVLFAGGMQGSGLSLTPVASAELYDPATGTFAASGSLRTARAGHTATLLPSGTVLFAGGIGPGTSLNILASAEVYDPATGTFAATGPLGKARFAHSATLLPSGTVLVAGGINYASGTFLASTEVYDPAVATFAPAGALATARARHTATLLPSGKVLAAGGVVVAGGSLGTATASAELYDPTAPSINGTSCTAAGECASGYCVDGVCCDSACAGDCNSCNLDDGHRGACTAAPDGRDPRGACQSPPGGNPACARSCQGGQCAFPDADTKCGTCAGCDRTGQCATTPADDTACGWISCRGLITPCRRYLDLSTDRCASLGVCKTADDPTTCTVYTDLACDAGTQYDGARDGHDAAPADGGARADAATDESGSAGGCSCRAATSAGASRPALVLAAVALLALGRLRRRARLPAPRWSHVPGRRRRRRGHLGEQARPTSAT